MKATAQRMINAENHMIETIIDIAGVNADQAVKIMSAYKRFKVIKLDATIGRYQVKHGAFMDKNVMINALKEGI